MSTIALRGDSCRCFLNSEQAPIHSAFSCGSLQLNLITSGTFELFAIMFKKQNQLSYTSESMTVKLEIPDFTNKMNAGPEEKIESPSFKIRGKDLRIQVKPNDKGSKHIGVYLLNHSEDPVTAKFTVKVGGRSSVLTVFKRREIQAAGQRMGLSDYKSHKEYKWFIKSDDDVFTLEFEVTLYFIVEEIECPKKRYLLVILFSSSICLFCSASLGPLRLPWPSVTSERRRSSLTSV